MVLDAECHMKRIILALLFLPQLTYAQYRANVFNLESSNNVSQMEIKETFGKDTTIIFSEKPIISGLSISGTAILNNDNDSYIRITLVDEYNYEFLVYENYPALSDELTSTFNNVALETVLLDDITPQYLKINLLNASLSLDAISISISSGIKKHNTKNPATIQKAQTQYIIDKLNANLKKKNMTWRAGMTSISELTYSEKKDMFGGTVPELYDFEHYVGGVFVMPGEYLNTPKAESSDVEYVTEWDWRNRHGKNWMTHIKEQNFPHTCGSCWAHAAVGVLETYMYLYYNTIFNIDLSEEELISCTQYGCGGNALEQDAFDYIKASGIVSEGCFPYTAQKEDCSKKCVSPSEQIFIEDYGYYIVTEDSMKRQLFRAPITLGLNTWHHSMACIGYKKIAVGSSIYDGYSSSSEETIDFASHANIIGRTAWLVKNSFGLDWGNGGYGYVIVDANNINGNCFLKGRITSLKMTDDNIVCEDADGDGLYFWGLGPKPAHCPSWVPDTPDGDDHDINSGALDNYGNLEELPTGKTINAPITYMSDCTIDYRLGVVKEGILTIKRTVTLEENARIRVCEGGTLVVDGGTLENADITMVPGSTLIVKNNGRIKMALGKEFHVPVGAIVNIVSGEIN